MGFFYIVENGEPVPAQVGDRSTHQLVEAAQSSLVIDSLLPVGVLDEQLEPPSEDHPDGVTVRDELRDVCRRAVVEAIADLPRRVFE